MKITGKFIYDVASQSLQFIYDGDDFYGNLPVRPVPDEDYGFIESESIDHEGNPVPSLSGIRMAFNPKPEKRGQLMMVIENRAAHPQGCCATAAESHQS